MTQDYAAVLKVIQETCPELMELSFGCEAITREPLSDIEAKAFPIPFGHWIILERRQSFNIGTYIRMIKKDAIWSGNSVEISRDTFNGIMIVFGHTPRLSHVLRTIKALGEPSVEFPSITMELKGRFKNTTCHLLDRWDLSNDDLSLQSPETIDFLFKILCE